MKKLNTLCLSLFLISCQLLNAQFTVINTFAPQGMRYQDGWSAYVTNPTGSQIAWAELEITKNNQSHFKALSEHFDLPNGLTTLDFSKIRISQIVINSDNAGWNQFLTFGHYQVCLRIYTLEQHGSGEGCTPLDIMPVSPPVIISPEDQAQVNSNPIFSWSPPVPLNIFKNICYSLKIVPVYPGQSAYEAMSRNQAVLNEPCISSLSFIYNITNLPLEGSGEYAWQVTAMDQGTEVGKSQVQTIKVKQDKEIPKEVLIPDYYYKLRKTEDGNFGTAKGCLGFTCEDEKLDSMMKFKIYDGKNKLIGCSDKIKLKKIGDENYFILELASCNEFKAKDTYRLEVVSQANKKYLLYFKYSEPETK